MVRDAWLVQHPYYWDRFAHNFTAIAVEGFQNSPRLLLHMYAKQLGVNVLC